jgi:hypothetical protein
MYVSIWKIQISYLHNLSLNLQSVLKRCQPVYNICNDRFKAVLYVVC